MVMVMMGSNGVLLLSIFLNVLPHFLTDELPISYGCKKSYATVKFKNYKNVNTTLKFWKLKDDDGEIHLELVASLFQGKVEVYGRYKEHSSVDEEGNLRIVNVSKDYEGVYRREIRNGGTFRELVVFKVLDPPSGPPTIQQRLDERGKTIVFCVNPSELGNPKASVLKESFGNTQNDNVYRCCLKGESVDRCYSEDLPRCSSYTTLNKTSEDTGSLNIDTSKDNNDNHLTKECDKTGLCVAIAVVAFIVCLVILFCCILFSSQANVYKSVKTPNGGCIADKYRARLIDISRHRYRLAASLTISTVLLSLSSGYFCSKEGCDNGYLMSLVGVSCFIIGMLLSFLSIFKPSSNVIKKKTSIENIRMKKTYASRVTPHLDSNQPLLDENEDTDSEIDQTPNGMVENELHNKIIISGFDDSISRKQTRKYNKIEVLKKGMTHKHWNQNQKTEINKILTPDYMSSEESEYEDDKEEKKLKCYKVKHLEWEDEKVKHLKESLYKDFEVYEAKTRYHYDDIQRINSDVLSERPIPKDAPAWVVHGNSSSFLEYITSGDTNNISFE